MPYEHICFFPVCKAWIRNHFNLCFYKLRLSTAVKRLWIRNAKSVRNNGIQTVILAEIYFKVTMPVYIERMEVFGIIDTFAAIYYRAERNSCFADVWVNFRITVYHFRLHGEMTAVFRRDAEMSRMKISKNLWKNSTKLHTEGSHIPNVPPFFIIFCWLYKKMKRKKILRILYMSIYAANIQTESHWKKHQRI